MISKTKCFATACQFELAAVRNSLRFNSVAWLFFSVCFFPLWCTWNSVAHFVHVHGIFLFVCSSLFSFFSFTLDPILLFCLFPKIVKSECFQLWISPWSLARSDQVWIVSIFNHVWFHLGWIFNHLFFFLNLTLGKLPHDDCVARKKIRFFICVAWCFFNEVLIKFDGLFTVREESVEWLICGIANAFFKVIFP